MKKTKIKDDDFFEESGLEHDDELKQKMPKKRVRRTKEQLKTNYVDPIYMEEMIKKFYETDVFSSELADMIQKIATRLGFAQNFINYSYKEEMIGDAVIKMVTALKRRRFLVGSGYNPFSYFTKVAFRAFQNRIKKEKKDHDTIKRYQASVYGLLTESGQIPYQKKGNDDDENENSWYNEECDTTRTDDE